MVIPVWDDYAGDGLAEAIASVREQAENARILLVDNASEREIDAGAGVEVVRSASRVSVGAARRLGLERSETPWTLFWDADDVMLPGTLPKLLEATRERSGVVAVTSSIMDGATGRAHHWPRGWTRHLSRRPAWFAVLNAVSSLYPTIGALVLTRAALDAGGHPDADGGDDWAFGVSLAFRGQVIVLKHHGRLYRRHSDSLSAGWRSSDISAHAALVRRQLRGDPAVPRALRRTTWVIGALQWLVLRVARPISRATPARRRASLPRP